MVNLDVMLCKMSLPFSHGHLGVISLSLPDSGSFYAAEAELGALFLNIKEENIL